MLHVAWSVCLCVLCVCHTGVLCKNGWIGPAVFAYIACSKVPPMIFSGSANPQNCPFYTRDLDSPSNTYNSLGPPESASQTAYLDRFHLFAGLTNVSNRPTDTHTDRPRYSVCGSSPHLMQYACYAA